MEIILEILTSAGEALLASRDKGLPADFPTIPEEEWEVLEGIRDETPDYADYEILKKWGQRGMVVIDSWDDDDDLILE